MTPELERLDTGNNPAAIDISLDKLSSQQRAVHDALNGKDERLASMYQGVLAALHNVGNPERFPQAAQSVRELMEKLPAYLNIPLRKAPEHLKIRVRELAEDWAKASKESTYKQG